MQIREFDAKALLATMGIAVPTGALCHSAEEVGEFANALNRPVAVKADLKQWGRGKAGFIQRSENAVDAAKSFDEIRKRWAQGLGIESEPAFSCLVEEWIEVRDEFYFALVIDPAVGGRSIGFSRDGGADIEEGKGVSWMRLPFSTGPREIHSRRLMASYGLDDGEIEKARQFIHHAECGFSQWDARLLEINPLAWDVTVGPIALDVKLIIDDNALGRQQHMIDLSRSDFRPDLSDVLRIENKIEFVELDGDIGLISGGAGMTMAVSDLLTFRGGKSRCFLDCSQNPSHEGYGRALQLLDNDPHTTSILVNVVGGGQQVDKVAEIFVDLLEIRRASDMKLKPIVIRLEGTNSDLAHKILSSHGICWRKSLEEAIDLAIVSART